MIQRLNSKKRIFVIKLTGCGNITAPCFHFHNFALICVNLLDFARIYVIMISINAQGGGSDVARAKV